MLARNNRHGYLHCRKINPGNQKLDESNPSNLAYGISITDACIGWEETEVLLEEAYNNIK